MLECQSGGVRGGWDAGRLDGRGSWEVRGVGFVGWCTGELSISTRKPRKGDIRGTKIDIMDR
jgi:hypothetical protein